MTDRIIEIIERHKNIPYEQGNFILTHSWVVEVAADINAAFEERLREELVAYDKWMSRNKWGTGKILSPEKSVNEYLKSHQQQPTIKGAEEILPTDYDIAIEIVARFLANPHPKQRANYEREKKAFANGAIYMREAAQRLAAQQVAEVTKDNITNNRELLLDILVQVHKYVRQENMFVETEYVGVFQEWLRNQIINIKQ
ncbi:MAG: hypothetical protein M0P71_13210 [Melioribacteraceae bacterium]|jgi:hypothetical protein|nr:hypothetical protein [Melioribacteraceae bacterium]